MQSPFSLLKSWRESSPRSSRTGFQRPASCLSPRQNRPATISHLVVVLFFVATAPSLLLTSCVKYRIVRQGFEPPPEARGFMVVATDKPIPVAVEGESAIQEKNVAGYYLLHASEVEVFVQGLRYAHENFNATQE